MAVMNVTADSFENEVLKSDKAVMVDFWASWCGPCRMTSPIMEEIASEFDDRAKICKVDIDANEELAQKYRIMSIPSVFIFRDGRVVQKSVGVKSKQEFSKMLEESI